MNTLIEKIPAPRGEHIKLQKVEKIHVPHLYCITPKHLTGKSMYLNHETIRDAEKNNGAVCDICRKLVKMGRQERVLTVDEHREELTIFLEVPAGDLEAIPGLKEYLLKIKPILLELGIGGVAFEQARDGAEKPRSFITSIKGGEREHGRIHTNQAG
jgi:hypothetical protein